MVQPLVITKQEPAGDKLKLHFTVNKPGIFQYVPEYCGYSLDNGSNWYRAVEVRQHGHCDDPLFVPQGGQGFIYVFNGPSADELESAGTLYPQVITRLTLIERDCTSVNPGTPSYMDPEDPGTGQPPTTGQPPVTGQPPQTGEPGDGRGGPEDAAPVAGGGLVGGGADPNNSNPDAPSPGTPGSEESDASDTLPPGGPTYPGYPGGPGDLDAPPTGTPNNPQPPVNPPEDPPGLGPRGEDPPGQRPDPPLPGDDVPPAPDDQGPNGGILDPRSNPPVDAPVGPPGGFQNPPPQVDTGGEGGPEAPQPLPNEPPTNPPVPLGPPSAPPVAPPTTPGAEDLPDPSPVEPIPPYDPFPPPPGAGGVTTAPGGVDDRGIIPLPPDYIDPHAPKEPDGNVDGLTVDPTIVVGAAFGVPSAGGTDTSFRYESSSSAWTRTTAPDMGEPGMPTLMVPPGNYSGTTLEVYAMPSEVHNDTEAVVVTARLINVSYPVVLPEAKIIIEFITPNGIVVWLGESEVFNLLPGYYRSVSKVIPAHALWPTGLAHVRAILVVHKQPVGDAIGDLHLMDIPEVN